jgi:hypothetical protein
MLNINKHNKQEKRDMKAIKRGIKEKVNNVTKKFMFIVTETDKD